jgi:holo-[acyl-carrier protein] synthase
VAVIGVGIDLVDLERAERMLARHGDRAMRRFLLPAERTYVLAMAHPARHFAVRLAAKEAVYKAMTNLRGASAVSWREIEVTRDRRGRPSVVLHGRADRVASAGGPYRLFVSLTHTDRTAGAVAVLEAEASISE